MVSTPVKDQDRHGPCGPTPGPGRHRVGCGVGVEGGDTHLRQSLEWTVSTEFSVYFTVGVDDGPPEVSLPTHDRYSESTELTPRPLEHLRDFLLGRTPSVPTPSPMARVATLTGLHLARVAGTRTVTKLELSLGFEGGTVGTYERTDGPGPLPTLDVPWVSQPIGRTRGGGGVDDSLGGDSAVGRTERRLPWSWMFVVTSCGRRRSWERMRGALLLLSYHPGMGVLGHTRSRRGVGGRTPLVQGPPQLSLDHSVSSSSRGHLWDSGAVCTVQTLFPPRTPT